MNMAHPTGYAYGLWPLVLINIGLFVGFLLSFAKPGSKIEWRNFGVFSAFLVALFVEMYGFPLSIYLLTSWLGGKYPVADPFSHANGHLLGVFFGIRSDHGTLLHLLSNFFIFGGALLISFGWSAIHRGKGTLVTKGLYRYVRHPQYVGFIGVIVGFLIQWPTLVTLIMAPILIIRYARLAHREEIKALEEYNEAYRRYMERVPAWIPRFRKEGSNHG